MKKKPLLTSIFILFIIHYSFSQKNIVPAYVIKNNMDTIYGTGSINKNFEYCLFKSIISTEFTKYYPSEVNTFREIDGKYYVSKKISNSNGKTKWYFLEYLVNGEIDLFQLQNSGRFFLEKDNKDMLELNDRIKRIKTIDGKEYSITDKKYIGFLKVYMSDAPEIFPKIEEFNRLEQRNLINIAMDYHNAVCKEYECINYTKKIPKVIYKLEVLSGVNFHNRYYTPQYGVLFHIWRPLQNERLYLKVGILYSDKPYWKKGWPQDDLEKEKRKYSIKIPISLQYVFGKKNFKPTFAIGFPTGLYPLVSAQGGFIYSIADRLELSASGSIDGLLILLLNAHPESFDNNLGHTLNFGLIYRIN